MKQISKQNREKIEEMEKQIDILRNENLDLKQAIRESNKEKLVLKNATDIQFQSAIQQYNHGLSDQMNYNNEYGQEMVQQDPLIDHFEKVDIN